MRKFIVTLAVLVILATALFAQEAAPKGALTPEESKGITELIERINTANERVRLAQADVALAQSAFRETVLNLYIKHELKPTEFERTLQALKEDGSLYGFKAIATKKDEKK